MKVLLIIYKSKPSIKYFKQIHLINYTNMSYRFIQLVVKYFMCVKSFNILIPHVPNAISSSVSFNTST